jgi:NAD(P)H-hydrate epimerase
MSAYLTRAQVRAFDRRAVEHFGIPSLVLMENAGRGTAEILLALGVKGPVVICCGKGNNGGDGLVIARYLANHDVEVKVLLFARTEELSSDAAAEWRIIQAMRLATEIMPAEDVIQKELARADWVVDALFGTGLNAPLRPPLDRVAVLINTSTARILAVDIPSGLDADTGEAMGVTIRAQHTATFVAPKVGFKNPNAAAWLGQIHVVDIGITPRHIRAV